MYLMNEGRGGPGERWTVPVRRRRYEGQQEVAELDRRDAFEVVDVAERLNRALRDSDVEELLEERRRQEMVLRDAESE